MNVCTTVTDDSRSGTTSDAFGVSSFGHSNAASATAPGADSADSQTSAELLDLQVSSRCHLKSLNHL